MRDKHRRRSSASSSSTCSSSFDTACGSGSGFKAKVNTGNDNANGSKSGSVPKSDDDEGKYELEIEIPNILTYDRFGQGSSSPDPSDPDPFLDNTPYGHTPLDVVNDLHQLLLFISDRFLSRDLKELDVVMIANSIGCPLARLYNAHYPSTRILGYLFLDSMMANSDFVSVFPDPDAEGFDPEKDLKEGVSEKDLRWTRQKFREKFHPSVGNPERLDRRGLRGLLPWSDRPKLALPEEVEEKLALDKTEEGMTKQRMTRPKVIVIGHDWDIFADQNEKGPMSIPKAVINGYMNPAWQRYNEGLTHLASDDNDNVVPVKIAKDCGHFIQKDDPEMVTREVDSLLMGLGM